MKIRFWGVRGSLPVPGPDTVRYGGNTSCVEVRSHEGLIIIDGGSGLRNLGDALVREQAATGGEPLVCHMLFGHAHWDHIQGFPFFVPAYMAGNIIHLYTAEGNTRRLDEALAGQQEFTYFPVRFTEMSATIVHHDLGTESFTTDDVAVSTTPLNHPGGCLGYRLEENGRAMVYLCDHEPYLRVLDSPTTRLQLLQEGRSIKEARAEAEENDRRIVEFSRGAEIMIADAAYTEAEYPAKAGYGHSSVDDVLRRAAEAEVKLVALTHHDMSHSDEDLDDIAEYARDFLRRLHAPVECVVAYEGLALDV